MNILSWISYLCPFKWPLHIWEIAIHIFKILCRLLTQDLWTDTFLHTELRSYTNDIIKIDNFVNWHLNLHVVMYKNNNKKQTRCIVLKVGGGWGWRKTQPINLDNQNIINQFFICRFEKNVCCKKKVTPYPPIYVPEKVFIVLFLNQWDWTQIPNLKKLHYSRVVKYP